MINTISLETSQINVCVIGLGYIGLPTAALLASKQIFVHGVDINPIVVDLINCGKAHIIEPEIDSLVEKAFSSGYLCASNTPVLSDVFLIAVPTPFCEENKPDLTYINSAVETLSNVLRKGNLIILESTSPVGTTEHISHSLAELRSDLTFPHQCITDPDISIAYCPERVLPGMIFNELVNNDRVIGGLTERCSLHALDFYKTFVKGNCSLTSARTAEMCKLVENSYRDTNIAFANELSIITDELNIDVFELIELANYHPRVNILRPGPGVGGHCIAVDPWFIVSKNPSSSRLIKTARQVNDYKPIWVVNKVSSVINEIVLSNPGNTLDKINICCFGLAFKPDIDDLRESPALMISKTLHDLYSGCVFAVEPNQSSFTSEATGDLKMCDLHSALDIADVAVILVAHHQFINIPRDRWKNIPQVIDVCGLLSS